MKTEIHCFLFLYFLLLKGQNRRQAVTSTEIKRGFLYRRQRILITARWCFSTRHTRCKELFNTLKAGSLQLTYKLDPRSWNQVHSFKKAFYHHCTHFLQLTEKVLFVLKKEHRDRRYWAVIYIYIYIIELQIVYSYLSIYLSIYSKFCS